jgi:hypothetical protein
MYTVGRAARHDIDSIATFYAGERRDLGARFIEEVLRVIYVPDPNSVFVINAYTL